jgi:hypothetical protein
MSAMARSGGSRQRSTMPAIEVKDRTVCLKKKLDENSE